MTEPNNVVAVMRLWFQCSADYNAELKTVTRVFGPNETISDVIAWSKSFGNTLGNGDIVLSIEDRRPIKREDKP